jgi:chemotaxis protein MotB
MYGKAGVLLKVLVVVAAVGIAAGCSTQLRQLQGANQDLVKQRDSLQRQIADLQGQLAKSNEDKADLGAKLKAAQADAEYWKGQAEAYGAASEKYKGLANASDEQFMRDLAYKIGAVYLPGGGMRLPGDILFESGKADLKASAKATLQTAAEAFQSAKAKDLYFRIDGHTDNVPIKRSHWKDNMELSQARSRAVWLALKTSGVAPERMYTAGFGEYRPADSNATNKGKQTNRRVEIWIVAAPTVQGQATGTQAAPAEETPAAPATSETPAATETPAEPASEPAPAASEPLE